MNIEKEELIRLAEQAGKEILEIYKEADFSKIVSYKSDDSPLTIADEASHRIIVNGLKELYPDVPIISEEGKGIEYSTRKDYTYYWLVDPLDGTKEFINKNGEFTVNIALIHENEAMVGFIFAPVLNCHYVGIKGQEAFKLEDGNKKDLKVNNKDLEEIKVAVRSKSHASPEEEEVLQKYNASKSISVGSSLKFCMVAEGKADIYYRHGPTMEWDTAAGQAILEAAGGQVLKNKGPEPFLYNKEELLNSSFLALGF